jgi:DNA replication licensing factor MCM2
LLFRETNNDHHPALIDNQDFENEDYDDEQNLEDEGSGDDLMDGMEADYQARPEMDRYENEGIDDDYDLNELSAQGRMLVDEDLVRRD